MYLKFVVVSCLHVTEQVASEGQVMVKTDCFKKNWRGISIFNFSSRGQAINFYFVAFMHHQYESLTNFRSRQSFPVN